MRTSTGSTVFSGSHSDLRARQRREIDQQLRNAYAGHADELLAEISDLMDAQEWPPVNRGEIRRSSSQ